LKKSRGVESKLIEGSNGVFDVVVDGERLFSKGELGRFPEPGEIAGMLETGPAA